MRTFGKPSLSLAATCLITAIVGTAFFGCGKTKGKDNSNPVQPPAEVVPTKEPEPVEPLPALVDDVPLNDAAAQLKGYVAIMDAVKSRMIAPGKELHLNQYFNGYGSARVGELEQLLGSHQGNGLTGGFKNGSPNAVNSVLQNLMLGSLAKDLGLYCGDRTNLSLTALQLHQVLSDRFTEKLVKMCLTPTADDAQLNAALLDYWLTIMGYDAPQSEFEAWKTFALAEYRDAEATSRVADLTLAILYNPYFLLKQ